MSINNNKIIVLSIVLICQFCFSQQIKVAIVDFDNTSGISKYDGLGKAMSSMLISDIEANVSPKRLQLVERSQINKILKEQNFQKTSSVDKASTVKMGKLLGVKFLLVGDIFVLNDALVINSRLVDTETGDIKFTEKKEGKLAQWLFLKTALAKGLSTSISMPFTEPVVLDKEINSAVVTTFSNAITEKDKGNLDKSEELLKIVEEFSADFKYIDDIKAQLEELKKQVKKNTEDIEVLKKSGDLVIDAESYDELLNNYKSQLISIEEADFIISKICDKFPNKQYTYEFDLRIPKEAVYNYSEDDLFSDLIRLKKIISSTKNKNLATKISVESIRKRLSLLIACYYSPNSQYSTELKGLSIEKRFLKVDLLINNFNQFLDSSNLNETEKKLFKIEFVNNLLKAFVKLDDVYDDNSFNIYSNLNSFKILNNELISTYNNLLKDDLFLLHIFINIKNLELYIGYTNWLQNFVFNKLGSSNFDTNSDFKYFTEYSGKIEKVVKLYQNETDFYTKFKLITFEGNNNSDYETNKKIKLNQLFNLKDGILNIDLTKFKELYNINVISSDFFENFFNAFKANAKDSINLNYVSEDETIIDSRIIDYILLSVNDKNQYQIICFF
jgi:TolB-like protein